jgi:hypothetical protein
MFRFVLTTLSLLSVAVSAGAQHLDISPGTAAGRIVTGGYDDAGSSFVPDVRVFGYDFGEDPLDPYFAEDPGFRSLAHAQGGTYPAGATLAFDIVSDLQFWTGTGFAGVPTGESLHLERGTFSVDVGTGETLPKTGLLIGTSDANGVVHEHLSAFLYGSDGNAVAGDGIEAAPGIYLLSLILRTDAAGVAESDPIWVVYNNGLSEEVHDEAIGWVEENLVPEPATALMLLLGGGLGVIRARRPATGW